MQATPREQLLLGRALDLWLLQVCAQALHVLRAHAGGATTGSPGPIVPPHALPVITATSEQDFDQTYFRGYMNAAADPGCLSIEQAHEHVAEQEHALAHAHGVLDAVLTITADHTDDHTVGREGEHRHRAATPGDRGRP